MYKISLFLLLVSVLTIGCAATQENVVRFSEANWNKVAEKKDGTVILRQDVTHMFKVDGKKYKYTIPTINTKTTKKEEQKKESEKK